MAKTGLRALLNTNFRFIAPLVVVLVLAVLWVFGTLPWLVLNYFMCYPEQGIACSDPQGYSQQARLILSVDILAALLSGLAIYLIRRVRRSGQ